VGKKQDEWQIVDNLMVRVLFVERLFGNLHSLLTVSINPTPSLTPPTEKIFKRREIG